MFWLLVGRLLSPFGLVYVLVRIIIIRAELLVWFNLNYLTCEIFRVENNIAIIIGILHFLYGFILTISINTDYLVQMLCD